MKPIAFTKMNRLSKNFISIIMVVFFSVSNCSENATQPKKEETENTLTGFYFMSGTLIETTYGFPWPSWGGDENIISVDTSKIAFTIYIEETMRQDTLLFTGLEGANTGEQYVFPFKCDNHPIECAYAHLQGNQFELNLLSPAGEYIGSGIFKDDALALESFFEYRSVRIDYSLNGIKVEKK